MAQNQMQSTKPLVSGKHPRIAATVQRKTDDLRWLCIWVGVLLLLGIWDGIFLNAPALRRVAQGAINTLSVGIMSTGLTLCLGWFIANILHYCQSNQKNLSYLVITFLLNLLRSIPQIIGILFGYIIVSTLVEKGTLTHNFLILFIISLCMSAFMLYEVVDLMRERIRHYQKSDFYNAMLVCGIKEFQIVNKDILWMNSRIHIFNKLISVFGMAVFLQCSVDFVVSVGLSSEVFSVNFPVTLGNLLASMESKQDILAIGHSLTNWSYIPRLFTNHLQGLTVAFLIVFSLMSIHRIAEGFAQRHRI